MGSTLYELCTTEQFRLKQKRHQLDKKIDKSYTELKKMEDLIEKKKEIHKKLPRAQSAEPTAPPAEVIEKIPGKPRGPQTQHGTLKLTSVYAGKLKNQKRCRMANRFQN